MPQYYDMYAYCGGNPINRFDPDGTTFWEKVVNWFKGEGWRDNTYKENLEKGRFRQMVQNAAHDLNTKNVKYSNDPKKVSGEGLTIANKRFTILIGKKACTKGLGWLNSTIKQHESTHREQGKAGKLSGTETQKNINEVEAYDKEIKAADENKLTEEQKEDISVRREGYYYSLPDELQKQIKSGNYPRIIE